MVKTKHTEGEWKIEQRGENCFVVLGSEQQVVAVADLAYQDKALSERENLANANLIAAAPALYEAINLALNETPWKPLGDDLKAVLREAKAKAEGKSNG